MKNLLIILSVLFLTLLIVKPVDAAAPTKQQMKGSIAKAEKYYEGLYQSVGDGKAVINEYYSNLKHTYTIRHGIMGGIYFYQYIGDSKKENALKNFIAQYNLNSSNDLHSYIWKETDKGQENLYSEQPYYDCGLTLPIIGDEFPYHSKVCKLGTAGEDFYITATKEDTLVPTIVQIQALEAGTAVDMSIVTDLQNKYNNLGFGMPICYMSMCANVASTIRTAEFGDLELRLGNMNYADKVASQLIKAQNDQGAVYFSYDRDGHLKDNKPFVYDLIDAALNDQPVYSGYIPTNAETMNDVLAFLLRYDCAKYNVCK